MNHTTRPARRITLAAATGLLVLGLSACSDNEKSSSTETSSENSSAEKSDDKGDDQRSRHALEQVVKANAATLDSQKEALSAVYSDVAVRAEGDNTLVFAYVFAEAVPEEMLTSLTGEDNPMIEQIRGTVLPQLEKAGVKEPRVRFTISNPDGTSVYDETVSAP